MTATSWSTDDLPSWADGSDLATILDAVAHDPCDDIDPSEDPAPMLVLELCGAAVDAARETYQRALELGQVVAAAPEPPIALATEDADLYETYRVGLGMHLFALACVDAMVQGRLALGGRGVRAVLGLLRRGPVDATTAAQTALALREIPVTPAEVIRLADRR
jgi:hypothetical protein